MPRSDIEVVAAYVDQMADHIAQFGFRGDPYGVPRRLKCSGCQVGDHCNGEDDGCYCECTEKAPSV